MVKGFKAMNPDMTCIGFQFEVGKTYEITNGKPLKTCNDSGFHFCRDLNDVFNYYNFLKCRLFEIEALGEVVDESNKSATNKIKIVRELTQEELNNHEFKKFTHDLWFKDQTDDELLKYSNHFSYKVRMIVAKKLKDLNRMFYTFKNDRDVDVRKVVAQRMEDLDLMYQTFKNDREWSVRLAVAQRMENLDLMYHTFKYDSDPHVRWAAREKMKKYS